MKRILLVLVLVPSLILFAGNSASAQRKLLILGSSTSNCSFGISVKDSCYVRRIQKYYADRGAPITVDNRSVAGDDVYRGMPSNYVPPLYRRMPYADTNITAGLQGNPDVVLINYPSNGYDSFTVREVMFCLRTIRDAANAAGKPCYITTTQPRNDPFLFRTSAVRRKMADIKDSILVQFGQFAVNFWDGFVNPADTTILPQYNGDGTHLNDAGHAIFAQRVLAKNMFNLVLPVKVLSFTGNNVSDGVELKWTVADEKNIRNYQVQKSTDGQVYTKVYEVLAENSDKQHDYSFVDHANMGKSAFYRLAIVGTDNFVSNSAIVEIKGKEALDRVFVAGSSTLIAEIKSEKAQPVRLGIFNSNGQLVLESSRSLVAGANRLSVGIQGLQKGLYFLRVLGEGIDMKARSFSK